MKGNDLLIFLLPAFGGTGGHARIALAAERLECDLHGFTYSTGGASRGQGGHDVIKEDVLSERSLFHVSRQSRRRDLSFVRSGFWLARSPMPFSSAPHPEAEAPATPGPGFRNGHHKFTLCGLLSKVQPLQRFARRNQK